MTLTINETIPNDLRGVWGEFPGELHCADCDAIVVESGYCDACDAIHQSAILRHFAPQPHGGPVGHIDCETTKTGTWKSLEDMTLENYRMADLIKMARNFREAGASFTDWMAWAGDMMTVGQS